MPRGPRCHFYSKPNFFNFPFHSFTCLGGDQLWERSWAPPMMGGKVAGRKTILPGVSFRRRRPVARPSGRMAQHKAQQNHHNTITTTKTKTAVTCVPPSPPACTKDKRLPLRDTLRYCSISISVAVSKHKALAQTSESREIKLKISYFIFSF